MPILIGDISPSEFRRSEVNHINHIRDIASLKNGDVVEFFGHALKFDEDCVTESICRQLQAEGDLVCDNALLVIFPKASDSVGKDLYETLVSYVDAHPGHNAASIFLHEAQRAPPSEIEVSEEEVSQGRMFFLDHAMQIMQAFLHYSLAGGFASVRIGRTLRAVSYLVPSHGAAEITKASNDRTSARLLETFQFVLDVTGCPPYPLRTKDSEGEKRTIPGTKAYLMPGGEGWKAALRVRMLHGVARRRTRERLGKAGLLGPEDVPISQEEMSATLGSFCIVPLWCLHRLGLPPTSKQAHTYLALWRHIGFYLGVSPAILTRYFRSVPAADKFLASAVFDLFSGDEPLDITTVPTIPILRAVSERPPSYSSFEYNCAVTRYLLGNELATLLGVPLTSRWMSVKMHSVFFLYKLPVWFSRWYPRRSWAENRRELLSEGIARSVRFNLGMRRPQFRPRTELQGEDHPSGTLAEGVEEKEAVVPDYPGAQVLVRKWKEMIAEMVIAHVVVGGLVLGAAVYALKRVGY